MSTAATAFPESGCRSSFSCGYSIDKLSHTFSLRLPLARKPLRFGDLRRGHVLSEHVPAFFRILVALRRRQGEPHVREDIVLRATLALHVHVPEKELCLGSALVRCEAIPRQRLCIVLQHAMAVLVQNPKAGLSKGLTLLRG